MLDPVHDLLLEIARCDVAIAGAAGDLGQDHPCSRVIAFQGREDLNLLTPSTFHLPEPWQGDIARAPLLFISSNPSINPCEHFPTAAWSDTDIINFFEGGFSSRARAQGRSRYWSSIHKRALELFGRNPRPGIDYALTEVVRCKSRNEVGVPEALPHCAGRFLSETLRLSNANVIFAVGEKARRHLSNVLDLGQKRTGDVIDLEIGGRDLIIGFGAHPSSFGKQRIVNTFSPANMARMREALLP